MQFPGTFCNKLCGSQAPIQFVEARLGMLVMSTGEIFKEFPWLPRKEMFYPNLVVAYLMMGKILLVWDLVS